MLSTSISSLDNIKAEERFTKIKMPPTMEKRGKPKGAELTVISLPSPKKTKRNNSKNMVVPFIKLKSAEKDKTLLECVFSASTANNALKGVLVTKEKLKSDLNTISDLIRDEKYVELHRIEKYFEDSACTECLKLCDKKRRVCSVCQNIFSMGTDSVVCERCLEWNRLRCTPLKKLPKVRNWYCKSCRIKFVEVQFDNKIF